MAEIRRIASVALALRASAGIKVRQPLAKLEIKNQISKVKEDQAALFEILKDEVNVKEVIINPTLKEEFKLDTAVTHKLQEEGWLRELVRAVQGLRADAKLEPKDTVNIFLEVPDELEHVVSVNRDAFLRDVKAHSVEFKRAKSFDAELDTKLDDWKVWIALAKRQN